MSSYALIETIFVGLIGLVCGYQVMKILMPRLTSRLRASIANRLVRGQGEASILPAQSETNACGAGCASACNGCGVSARMRQPLAEQHDTSRY
jgi:Family of unknown function (DUF6587)